MSEEPSSSTPDSSRSNDKSWLERLMTAFSGEPRSREELLDIIREAADNKVVEQEELDIITGALDVAGRQVRDIQIPRSQMVVIGIDDKPQDFLPTVIQSAHSRFPVIGESTDDIRGILLAKDLLPLILGGTDNFKLKDIIRPATVIPESKRLNVLLKEFREDRYHMAMVIDEYGGISGLVTIEDILEEIVGDIEDETDDDEDAFIRKVSDNDYIVKALTPVEEFNEFFGAGFNEDDYVTIGGILMRTFGHLPQRNEVAEIDGFKFRILYADSRQIHLLRLTPPG
ncbi:MAG: CBS domain-containing protein [Gammaproteobacteria bacterium]|uniref:HlyC/CorC family transporter n=1 Tax=Pseudomaricurvus alcaniphilus TaxID=1166482 RepID=UPI00140A3B05|nr:transporter associated domain-containing protein [Pseudomaricurvus alcaniphilus]MBR9911853.1 CBS domain-containing protein [Gammaproteobacteria bacterium]NHN39282.1 CBS domain-containing protein [Pseudomaricurvus alcaniphilus]